MTAPSIAAPMKIALIRGYGAELVVGKNGLGFLISQGQNNDSVSTIFVGIISIGVLGILIDTIVHRSEAILLPWHKKLSKAGSS